MEEVKEAKFMTRKKNRMTCSIFIEFMRGFFIYIIAVLKSQTSDFTN